jgi:hypothetical protein
LVSLPRPSALAIGRAERLNSRLRALQRFSPETEVPRLNAEVDDRLSNRAIDLDPAGYFIIKLDRESREIKAEHFSNTINKHGAQDRGNAPGIPRV